MSKVISLLVLLVSFFTSGYSQGLITEDDLGKFRVELKPVHSLYAYDSTIIVRFEVTNISQTDRKFCKRNSPLEGQFISDFMIVASENGKAPYIGKSFQRMAPTDAEYITLGAMQMITWDIDLKAGYKIEAPGSYSIAFKGDNVNKLPDSEPLVITIQ